MVEPASTGIGGDCFCLYSPSGSSEIIAYNGSGHTPHSATRQWYAQNNITTIDRYSPHAVTVPGAVDAWDRLTQDHGNLTLKENLSAAINYARFGFPVSSRVSWDFSCHILYDGMDIQEAIDAPRFFPDPHSLNVDIEDTMPEYIQTALKKLGHQLKPAYRPIGGAQAICID